MKKIAFAMVLCASASFSPALAQSGTLPINSFVGISAVSEYSISVFDGRGSRTTKVGFIKLNGTDVLIRGWIDPDAVNKLRGATCTLSGPTGQVTATCTK